MTSINAEIIKEKLLEEPEKIETILQELGCEYIKDRGNYYSSTRPGGNNKQSVVVYKDTLVSNCYTLDIQDVSIFQLICDLKDLYFTHALKFVCDCCEYDYYGVEYKNENVEKSELIEWLDSIEGSNSKENNKEEIIRPLPESILHEYLMYPHKILIEEGINPEILKKFQVGYHLYSNSIVYPIRDELGTLVGVKARLLDPEAVKEHKFLALYSYPKGKILYGLYDALPEIKRKKEVIIVESEKNKLKLLSMGIGNVVATGTKNYTNNQMDKLLRLNVPITWSLDKDVKKEKYKKIVEDYGLFVDMFAMYDKWDLLGEKDSPCDKGIEVWNELYGKKFKIS